MKLSQFDKAKDAVTAYSDQLQAKCCPRTFRLILTDIEMPEMNGYELARQVLLIQDGLRQGIINHHPYGKQKTRYECPIVAVTAYPLTEVE